jgi:tetratricopeptide (TPR) repeat protein
MILNSYSYTIPLSVKLSLSTIVAGLFAAPFMLFLCPSVDDDIAAGLSELKHGRFRQSQMLLERAVNCAEEQTLQSAAAQDALAQLDNKVWKFQDAAVFAGKALQIRQSRLAPDSPLIAESLNTYATALSGTGDFSGALASYKQSLAIAGRQPDRALTADTLYLLGGFYAAHCQEGRAQSALHASLKLKEAMSTRDALSIAQCKLQLLVIDRRFNRYDRGCGAIEDVLKVQSDILGSRHPDVAATLIAMLPKNGSLSRKDERLFERAIDIQSESFGPEFPPLAEEYGRLSQMSSDNGRSSQYSRVCRVKQCSLLLERNRQRGYRRTYRSTMAYAAMLRSLFLFPEAFASENELAWQLQSVAGPPEPNLIAKELSNDGKVDPYNLPSDAPVSMASVEGAEALNVPEADYFQFRCVKDLDHVDVWLDAFKEGDMVFQEQLAAVAGESVQVSRCPNAKTIQIRWVERYRVYPNRYMVDRHIMELAWDGRHVTAELKDSKPKT